MDTLEGAIPESNSNSIEAPPIPQKRGPGRPKGSGKKKPEKTVTIIVDNCPVCKKEFAVKRQWQKYCSAECRNLRFTLHLCEVCGKPLSCPDVSKHGIR